MLSSQGVAMATAMAAFSGTLIFLSFCLQKSLSPHHQITHLSPPSLRSCISSDGKTKTTKTTKTKKKKKVQFAEDLVDRSRNDEELARKISSSSTKVNKNRGRKMELPANRVALYNGILRDRLLQRSAYSH